MIQNNILLDLKKNKALYIMGLPAILFFLIFSYIPMAGVLIAFKDYNVVDGIIGSPFSGLRNFEFLFKSQDAYRITLNTLRLNCMFILFGTAAQVGTALLLNEMGNRFFRKMYQSLTFIPYFISWVVVGAFSYNLFATDIGLLNSLRSMAGLEALEWYSKAEYWPAILTFTYLWKWTGYGSIIYLSAIAGIDLDIYESATIDGCNKLGLARYITLPMLIPTVLTMILLAIGRIFYGDFGMIFNIVKNNPLLYQTVDVIDTYVYRSFQGDGGNFAMGSAAGVYQSLMGFLVIMGANSLVRKLSRENALF